MCVCVYSILNPIAISRIYDYVTSHFGFFLHYSTQSTSSFFRSLVPFLLLNPKGTCNLSLFPHVQHSNYQLFPLSWIISTHWLYDTASLHPYLTGSFLPGSPAGSPSSPQPVAVRKLCCMPPHGTFLSRRVKEWFSPEVERSETWARAGSKSPVLRFTVQSWEPFK